MQLTGGSAGREAGAMPLVLGVDSSTQSTKVELRDLDSGAVVARGRAPHPPAVPPRAEQEPSAWWDALAGAVAEARADGGWAPADIAAVAVAGQQHGLVPVGADGRWLRPAKLWNDTESAPEAAALVAALGPEAWARAAGSVPVAAFTVTKVAWLAAHEPAVHAAVRGLLLPHDWLTRKLCGRAVTDRGDASGTGYWSPAEAAWRPDLLDLAAPCPHPDGWAATLPEVLGPLEPAGPLRAEAAALGLGHAATVVAPGTGDNMAAALGMGLQPGDVAISLGTSGTVYAVSASPTADPSGAVAGFADATGRFLPLVCTLNATLVTEAMARWLGVDLTELDRLAAGAPAGAGGVVVVPYLGGERTPNRPDATGTVAGLRTGTSREELARAAFEGVTCGLLDGLDALGAAGVDTGRGRLLLVGGGARAAAYRRAVADLAARPVVLPEGEEHVAAGACVQAAAMLTGTAPEAVAAAWSLGGGTEVAPDPEVDAAAVRAGYASARG